MTQSASSLMAILFGLGVFAVIVAVGWRSVQNRRLLRLRGASGQETIIVAGEGDDVSSVVTTETRKSAAAPAQDQPPETLADNQGTVSADRLERVVKSAE